MSRPPWMSLLSALPVGSIRTNLIGQVVPPPGSTHHVSLIDVLPPEAVSWRIDHPTGTTRVAPPTEAGVPP